MLEQIKAMLLEEYSVSQWVLLFFLYSFCGWCWEVFLYLVKERRFVNRGFLFGPILPIYGFGAVGILLTCVPVEGNMALVALAKDLRISVITTKRAYDELEREGLVCTVAGKGCFVAARNREWIREELLRQIETHLEKVAELAAQADVSGEELCEMLRALREENEP